MPFPESTHHLHLVRSEHELELPRRQHPVSVSMQVLINSNPGVLGLGHQPHRFQLFLLFRLFGVPPTIEIIEIGVVDFNYFCIISIFTFYIIIKERNRASNSPGIYLSHIYICVYIYLSLSPSAHLSLSLSLSLSHSSCKELSSCRASEQTLWAQR